MLFLIDHKLKIIFGWSAKCGCSHVKKICFFLQNNNIDKQIHTRKAYSKLPSDIHNYTSIIFCRNPYKRIISGFLDKYRTHGEFRKLWKYNTITFSDFVNELIKNDWKMIDQHHFTPQTSEHFNKCKLIQSKSITVYDIENINYNEIKKLYNKVIPESLLLYRGGHERKKCNAFFEQDKVYDLDMNLYYNYDVSIEHFYNSDIKNKVYEFYKNDFDFFKENGIDYTNNTEF